MKNIILFTIFISILLISCRNTVTDPNDQVEIEEKQIVYSLKDIQEPSERIILKPGENFDIKWEITENLDFIKISLLRKYNEVNVISESTNNDGLFSWSIPEDLPGSHHYRIKISSLYNLSASSTSVEFVIQGGSANPPETK